MITSKIPKGMVKIPKGMVLAGLGEKRLNFKKTTPTVQYYCLLKQINRTAMVLGPYLKALEASS